MKSLLSLAGLSIFTILAYTTQSTFLWLVLAGLCAAALMFFDEKKVPSPAETPLSAESSDARVSFLFALRTAPAWRVLVASIMPAAFFYAASRGISWVIGPGPHYDFAQGVFNLTALAFEFLSYGTMAFPVLAIVALVARGPRSLARS